MLGDRKTIDEKGWDGTWIENLCFLWQIKNPQQVLRRLVEILSSHFEFECLDFLKRERREGQWHQARKRMVRKSSFPHLSTLAMMDLKSLLKAEDLEFGDIIDGVHQITLKENVYSLALFEKSSDELVAMVWKLSVTHPHILGVVEIFVRAVQNELKWSTRIHRSEKLLYIDDLTGLYNTRYFEIIISNEIRRAERFRSEFTLLFIDLDGFKPINDQYGHLAGSQVLKQVAQLIRETVREVDIPIRFGGDEFIVMLIGASCEMGAMVAERVRSRIDEYSFPIGDGHVAHVTCSIGVASFPKHGRDKHTLTKIADESMYDSKRMGKNRVTVTTILGESTCSS